MYRLCITRDLRPPAVPAGSPLTLPCTASGWPRPAILWQREGRLLSPSDELLLLADGSLRITAVEPRVAGTYTCIAKNVIGTDMATVEIGVEGERRLASLCFLSAYPPEQIIVLLHERLVLVSRFRDSF